MFRLLDLVLVSDYVINMMGIARIAPEGVDIRDMTLADLYKYAKFVQTPLKLGLFIPCDTDGNILTEPDGFGFWWQDKDKNKYPNWLECHLYLEAKKRVVFSGWYVKEIYFSQDTYESNQELGHDDIRESIGTMYSTGRFTFHAPYKTIESLCGKGLQVTPLD